MLRSTFVKFKSILKRQVSSCWIFVSFFVAMTHNSIVNLKLIHFLLWTKGSYQSSNFDTFECSGENLPNSSCHFPNDKSVFLQILHHSSMSWKITPLYLFRSNSIYFAQKEPIKVKFFETFECSGQNVSNSLCQFSNDKSILLQILYPSSVSWKTTRLYFFRSKIKYFAQAANESASFGDFQVLALNFTKFLSFLKQQISFSSNFALIFKVIRYDIRYHKIS